MSVRRAAAVLAAVLVLGACGGKRATHTVPQSDAAPGRPSQAVAIAGSDVVRLDRLGRVTAKIATHASATIDAVAVVAGERILYRAGARLRIVGDTKFDMPASDFGVSFDRKLVATIDPKSGKVAITDIATRASRAFIVTSGHELVGARMRGIGWLSSEKTIAVLDGPQLLIVDVESGKVDTAIAPPTGGTFSWPMGLGDGRLAAVVTRSTGSELDVIDLDNGIQTSLGPLPTTGTVAQAAIDAKGRYVLFLDGGDHSLHWFDTQTRAAGALGGQQQFSWASW